MKYVHVVLFFSFLTMSLGKQLTVFNKTEKLCKKIWYIHRCTFLGIKKVFSNNFSEFSKQIISFNKLNAFLI